MGNANFPMARIPYGIWGSSFFPAWQSSPLAEVNIGQFAAEAAARILGMRGMSISNLDYLIAGSTVPWHWKFWNGPLLASWMGKRIPGHHVEQACATGLQAVAAACNEVESGSHDVVSVLTFDRTSDSPAGIFPERRALRRTEALSDVWDNFGFDPAAGKAMVACAGMAARKYRLDRREADALAFHRYGQYFDSKGSEILGRILVPLSVLGVNGRPMGTIDDDLGVRHLREEDMRSARELDSCVTSLNQTHPSDGMATLVVASAERAGELSCDPNIDISLVAKTEVRTHPSLMPEAPVMAARKLLEGTGLKIGDMGVIHTHNPFAVNDLIFAKEVGCDWKDMNSTGCSLVWGHPQGPTLTRTLIEALEESVGRGGGYVMVTGCAAGDMGIAAIFRVTDGGGK